jgi:hypothetical protein
MRIRLGRHEFEGPYVSSERLHDWPGVYAIISITSGVTTVIDVAATDQVKKHVQQPENVDGWREIARGRGIGVAVMYTHGMPAQRRRAIEDDIRNAVPVICKRTDVRNGAFPSAKSESEQVASENLALARVTAAVDTAGGANPA